MVLSTYHCHCSFCDGVGDPEEYAAAAVRKGFTSLGFSSHAPLPVPNEWTMREGDMSRYLDALDELARRFRGSLEILRSLEVDFVPGIMGPADAKYRSLGLDYIIGAVHIIPDPTSGEFLCIDGPDKEFIHLLTRVFKNDISSMVHDYFERVRLLIRSGGFQILAHIDLIRKKNRNSRFFAEEEPWYLAEIDETLAAAAAAGIMIEMNTGAMARGAMESPYPSFRTLAKARAMGIPIVLNSDAHSSEHIDYWFEDGSRMLREAGYTKKRILAGGRWTDTEI